MRRVACLAPVHTNGGMLVKERATLVRVAFQAGLFILETSVDEMRPASHFPRPPARAMGIVAVRTGHESLIYPVFEGLRKLCPDIVVATVADFYLFLRK